MQASSQTFSLLSCSKFKIEWIDKQQPSISSHLCQLSPKLKSVGSSLLQMTKKNHISLAATPIAAECLFHAKSWCCCILNTLLQHSGLMQGWKHATAWGVWHGFCANQWPNKNTGVPQRCAAKMVLSRLKFCFVSVQWTTKMFVANCLFCDCNRVKNVKRWNVLSAAVWQVHHCLNWWKTPKCQNAL